MINLKKNLIVFLLLCSAVFSLFGETPDSENNEQKRSGVESSIVLSDDGPSYVDNVNSVPKKSSSGGFLFLRMIIVLIIVVGLIFLVFFFIKKKTNVVKSDDEYLRRAAYINIAPGKTVEVITLIDKAYLIGVTEDNITLLGEIKDDELIKAMNITADKRNNTKKPANFSEVLDTFLVKGNKNKSVFDDTDFNVNTIGKEEDRKE